MRCSNSARSAAIHAAEAGDAQNVEESAKTAYLMDEMLPELIEEGRRILIFSQFTEMLALIETRLKKEGTQVM
jgi:SNF2 family DNA or RNA helicase